MRSKTKMQNCKNIIYCHERMKIQFTNEKLQNKKT